MTQNNANLPPLHTQNPLDRFSNRAEDYAKYRPSYPPEAIDCILAGLGQPDELQGADIGAGTGISARLVADRGVKVWAIEPNAAMREAAIPHPRVEFLETNAEQTGLPDQSVDLIVCGQSFHWFNKAVALPEFHRILKPGGRVAAMWNDYNREDEFAQEYCEVVGRSSDRQMFERSDRKSADALAESPLFQNFRSYSFIHSYALNQEGLIGLVLSSSYVPKSGEAYEQLMLDLQNLYERWSGRSPEKTVLLSCCTNLYLAEAVSS